MNDLLKMSLPFMIGGIAFAAFALTRRGQPWRARIVAYIIGLSVACFIGIQLFWASSRSLGIVFTRDYAPGSYSLFLDILAIPVSVVLLVTWMVYLSRPDQSDTDRSEDD